MISGFRNIGSSAALRRVTVRTSAQAFKAAPKQYNSQHLTSFVRLFSSTPEKNEEVAKDEGLKGKVGELWGKYGYVAVGTYISVYVSTLGGIFISMDYDIFNAATFGFDPVGAVKKVNFTAIFLGQYFYTTKRHFILVSNSAHFFIYSSAIW